MKKLSLIFSAVLLSACAHQTITELELIPPDIIKSGFIPLSQDSQEYIDTNSIWIDKSNKRLVHLEVMINLPKAAFVDEHQPEQYAKSIRQYKTLNCENHRLIHNKQVFYSEFWGIGSSYTQQKQETSSSSIPKYSPLHTIGQVMCAKLQRTW